MQLTDRHAFKQLLTGIGLLYGKSIHEFVLAIWWQAFARIEFDAVKKALESHVAHPDKGQFMPKPADVVEHLTGSSESQALKAWAGVAKTLREVGAYDSVVFPDPLIHAVISDMGGWVALCQSKVADLPFRAREFEKRYQAVLHHPPLHCPDQLTGLLAHHNQLAGYLAPQPVLVEQLLRSPALESI